MEIEDDEITLKFDNELIFQGLYKGDEYPEENKTDDAAKATKAKKVADGDVWHVPCSAAGCKICGNAGQAKPAEDRKSKSKVTLPGNSAWKAFVKGTNVAHFEGGFVIAENMAPASVKICAPVNTLIWLKSRNVPVVGVPGSEGGNFTKNQNDPEFTIPIYKGYLPVPALKDSIDAQRLFIYTGNKDNKSETQEQYMLVGDLRKRLEKGCEAVYKEDWNKLRNGERPFDVWNAEGTLIKAENNFLCSTFQLDPGSDDWLVALFRLYSDIANSAQRTPSEPWTVKARFWSKGIAKDDTTLGSDDFTVLFDSNLITKAELKSCITLVGNALCNKSPFKTPFILPDTCSLEGKPTWPEFKKRRQELEQTMVAIGRHPHLIYEIWTKSSNLNPAFWARSYRFRKDIDTDSLNELDKLEQKPNKADTHTTISTKSISAARNYPRTSQVKVMGKSANEIAKKVWCDSKEDCDTNKDHQCTFSGQAEWLHRSAFSFGGIDEQGPKSSQVQGNLVLGTKETNTKMIREEEFIKRFVRKTGKDVKLTTSLEADADGNKKLTTRLNYIATLPTPPTKLNKKEDKAKAEAAHGQINSSFYSLLERKVPTLFEVLLDVEVEKIVYRWGTGSDKWVYN